MNVNDTMNVNIQNVDPNQMQENYSQQNQNQGANYVSTPNNSYTNNIINDNYGLYIRRGFCVRIICTLY